MKKSHLTLKESAQFLGSVKSHDTCVYVASGPSADRCNEFPETDLIGVNNTWRIMKRKPLAILTQFAHYIDPMDPAFIPWLLCPVEVFLKKKGVGERGRGYFIDPLECGFPKEQLRTFEIQEERFLNVEKMMHKLTHNEMDIMLRFGGIGTYGLIFCALAGYRKIICCGHDGGIGRHPVLDDLSSPKKKSHDGNLMRTRELANALVQTNDQLEIIFVQDLADRARVF